MDAKLFVEMAESTFQEVTTVRNVTMTIEDAEADATTRGNMGWRVMLQTLRSLSVEVETVWDVESQQLMKLVKAHRDRNPVRVRVLDASAGAGVEFVAVVTSVRRQEPLEDVVTATITLKPAPATTVPQWVGLPE
jgi:MinD superfamily P-loop ATPase